MSQTMSGVWFAGTVTCAASGVGTISPAKSNQPYKTLSMIIQPQEATAMYTVAVYIAGELSETHTFPNTAGRIVCFLSYPDIVFPPNVGTGTIPQFFTPNRFDPGGVSVVVQITNNASAEHTYLVSGTFEEFDNCRFSAVEQTK